MYCSSSSSFWSTLGSFHACPRSAHVLHCSLPYCSYTSTKRVHCLAACTNAHGSINSIHIEKHSNRTTRQVYSPAKSSSHRRYITGLRESARMASPRRSRALLVVALVLVVVVAASMCHAVDAARATPGGFGGGGEACLTPSVEGARETVAMLMERLPAGSSPGGPGH